MDSEIRIDDEFSEAGGTADAPKRKSIQSVEVGIRLLNVLADADRPLRLRDVAVLSGLSRSQAHRYLLSYVNTGMVYQLAEAGQYELGPLAIKVGLAALRRSEPVAVAGDVLLGLVEETGLTGMLIAWGQFGPTIIRLRTGRRHVAMSLQVGSVLPVLSSSAGRLFIAYLQEGIATEAIKEEWKHKGTKDAGGWKAQLKKCQYQVREDGYSSVDGTTILGLSAISVPVLDCEGQIALAMTLVGHETDGITERQDIIDALLAKGQNASHRLGYSEISET